MRRFLALMSALLLLVGLSATPAQAAAVAELNLVSARLVEQGTAVDVTFNVKCAGEFEDMHPAYFSLRVQVAQRLRRTTVSGSALVPPSNDMYFDHLSCGDTQHVTVRVYATSPKKPNFRPKTAMVTATLRVDDCCFPGASASTLDIVRLSKRGH